MNYQGRRINIERYKALKEEVVALSNTLDELMTGNLTVKEMADKLGLNYTLLAREDVGLERLLKGELSEMINFELTPIEKMLHHVHGYIGKVVIQDVETEEHILSYLKETLSEREYDILDATYGLDGQDPIRSVDIAAKYNVSQTRITQIKQAIFRKLRHPKHKIKMFGPIVDIPEEDEVEQRDKLEVLGLASRTNRALRGKGYVFVDEVMDLSDKELLMLRNFGVSSLMDLRRALDAYKKGEQL